MINFPVAISISHNTSWRDFWEAVKIVFWPFVWKKGEGIAKVENWFKNFFQVGQVYSFNSGRSSLMWILQAFNIKENDEVLIQPYTCIAAIAPVIWAKAKVVFVDIDETLNINPDLIEGKISKKTKAVIVQHTFWIPAKIKEIKKICQKHKLILIEDCALSLGASVTGKKVGTFGDAAYFSFGRDKVISSVFGGLAFITPSRKKENKRMGEFYQKLEYPKNKWILQQLLHPIQIGRASCRERV